MDGKVQDLYFEVRPGVWGLTDAVWESQPSGTFYAAVWYNFTPEPHFVVTFKRRDKAPLVVPKTKRVIGLSLNDAEDLKSVLWPAVRMQGFYTMAEEIEPYALLKPLGIRIDK